MLGSECLEKGRHYADLPDLFIVYLSETDLWEAGFTTYLVKKYFENTDIPYDDGQHIMYVNAAINDGTEMANLMQYFKTADPDDMNHGDLSKRIHWLKCEEGGYQEMCEISEKIFKEGQIEGELKKAKSTAMRLADMGLATEKIAEAVEVSTSTVKQWLDNRVATAR